MTRPKIPFPLSPSKTAPAIVIALVVLAALLAGVLSPSDPLEQDTARRLQPPGAHFLLGSDNFGRDVLSRVLHGTRTALAVAVGGVATGALVGAAVGLASAYRGGWFDLVVQRVVDALLGFPLLALAVVVVVSLNVSVLSVATAIAVALAPQAARLARSSALSVRSAGYVASAVTIGASPARVLLRHVLPTASGPSSSTPPASSRPPSPPRPPSATSASAPPRQPPPGATCSRKAARIPRNRPLANPSPRRRPRRHRRSLRPPRRRPLRPPNPPFTPEPVEACPEGTRRGPTPTTAPFTLSLSKGPPPPRAVHPEPTPTCHRSP